MLQVGAEIAVLVWNVGVLVPPVVTVEVGRGFAEAPAVLTAKGIPVAKLLVASVSIAVIEHRVHIDVEPIRPHDRHGALEFLPFAPVRWNGLLLVFAAEIVVIEGIEAG